MNSIPVWQAGNVISGIELTKSPASSAGGAFIADGWGGIIFNDDEVLRGDL